MPRSTGSVSGWPWVASNRASQSRSSSEPVHPLRLEVDPLERGPVPGLRAVLGQGQAGMGLDDRQRRPQLVRGVRGELELAAPGDLDRGGDPAADRHRAEEDDEQEHRPDDELGRDDRRLGLGDGVERLRDDQPGVADLAAGDPDLAVADGRIAWVGHPLEVDRQVGVRRIRGLDGTVRERRSRRGCAARSDRPGDPPVAVGSRRCPASGRRGRRTGRPSGAGRPGR